MPAGSRFSWLLAFGCGGPPLPVGSGSSVLNIGASSLIRHCQPSPCGTNWNEAVASQGLAGMSGYCLNFVPVRGIGILTSLARDQFMALGFFALVSTVVKTSFCPRRPHPCACRGTVDTALLRRRVRLPFAIAFVERQAAFVAELGDDPLQPGLRFADVVGVARRQPAAAGEIGQLLFQPTQLDAVLEHQVGRLAGHPPVAIGRQSRGLVDPLADVFAALLGILACQKLPGRVLQHLGDGRGDRDRLAEVCAAGPQ